TGGASPTTRSERASLDRNPCVSRGAAPRRSSRTRRQLGHGHRSHPWLGGWRQPGDRHGEPRLLRGRHGRLRRSPPRHLHPRRRGVVPTAPSEGVVTVSRLVGGVLSPGRLAPDPGGWSSICAVYLG